MFTEKMIMNKRVLDFGCDDGGYLIRAKTIASEVAELNWKWPCEGRCGPKGSIFTNV